MARPPVPETLSALTPLGVLSNRPFLHSCLLDSCLLDSCASLSPASGLVCDPTAPTRNSKPGPTPAHPCASLQHVLTLAMQCFLHDLVPPTPSYLHPRFLPPTPVLRCQVHSYLTHDGGGMSATCLSLPPETGKPAHTPILAPFSVAESPLLPPPTSPLPPVHPRKRAIGFDGEPFNLCNPLP